MGLTAGTASLPAIITAASASPLGILALLIVACGGAGLVFFRRGPVQAQVAVYSSLFFAALLYGLSVFLQAHTPAPPVMAATAPQASTTMAAQPSLSKPTPQAPPSTQAAVKTADAKPAEIKNQKVTAPSEVDIPDLQHADFDRQTTVLCEPYTPGVQPSESQMKWTTEDQCVAMLFLHRCPEIGKALMGRTYKDNSTNNDPPLFWYSVDGNGQVYRKRPDGTWRIKAQVSCD